MVPPVTRTMSDTSSIWELQSTAPQTTGRKQFLNVFILAAFRLNIKSYL